MIEPPDPTFQWASRVAAVGDLNADGYADVAFGDTGANMVAGRVDILFGSPDRDPPVVHSIPSPHGAYSYFGAALAGGGDLDGDGFGDSAVGAPATAADRGWFHVYFGGPGHVPPRQLEFAGPTVMSGVGFSLSMSGDLNGDGRADLIVGAQSVNSFSGAVLVYLGTSTGLSDSPAQIDGPVGDQAFFGSAVSIVGDVNGDGFADAVLAAQMANRRAGRATLHLGSSTGLSPTGLTLEASGVSEFGGAISALGDVNADGFADFVVGGQAAGTTGGRIFLFLGSSTPSSTPAASYTSDAVDDAFGSRLASRRDNSPRRGLDLRRAFATSPRRHF